MDVARMIGVRLATLLVAAAATTACASGEPGVTVAVQDSAGVRIVENPATAPLPEWTLAATPEAVIGRPDATDPAQHFTQIRGAIRLSDGRIVVGDWGSREARYFDASGAHMTTVGGQGTGPGELRNLYHVDRLDGDTLVIGGWPIGTRYWFDAHGEYVMQQALGPWYPGLLGRTLVDGSLILDTYEFGSYGNTLEMFAARGTEDTLRPEGLVESVSRDGSRVDTIGVIRGQTNYKTGSLGDNFAMHALPFAPIGRVAWSRDRIFIGHTEQPEVRAYDLTGVLVAIIRWDPDPVPVTGADRDAFERELIDGLRNPARAPYFRRWLLEASYPETMPTFETMIADEDGNLWIRATTSAGAVVAGWTIYGPEGSARAKASLPANLEVLDVDATHVIGKRVDELGVETVFSYRFER